MIENRAKPTTSSEQEIAGYRMFLVHTGARIGEGAGMFWDAVDLKTGIVSIVRTVWWDRHSRAPHLQNEAKTDGSIRIILLPPPIQKMLTEMKISADPKKPVFGDKNGDLLRYSAIQNAFNFGFQKLNLPWRSTHICRHSFGTLALIATRDLPAVQAAMGHKDIRVTQKYAKVAAVLDKNVNNKTADLIALNLAPM